MSPRTETVQPSDRERLFIALRTFVRQRPGLEFGNYGDRASYFAERRSIARDKREAERLLDAVEWRDSIEYPEIVAGFRAFSGRLTWHTEDANRWHLDYCTGQYFPTEYRRAVCAVMAAVLWDHKRAGMPSDEALAKAKTTPGDWLRRSFVNEFGRGIAARWFR